MIGFENQNETEILSIGLKKRAERLGLKAETNTSLVRNEVMASSIAKSISKKTSQSGINLDKNSEDFDSTASLGLKIGEHFVLIAPLIGFDDEDEVLSQVRKWQKQAAIATTYQVHELNLFFVAPQGSSENLFWRSLSEQIEKDELICRKMVWRPPALRSSYAKSIDEFLKRTFLARPWDVEVQQGENMKLDEISLFLKEMIGGDISQDLVNCLEDSELDLDDLVNNLVAAPKGVVRD